MEFCTNHSGTILNNLNSERTTTKDFCDFTIKTDNTEFRVHRCIVGSFSEFYKRLLTCEMKEKYTNEVNVKEVSSAIMALVLNFIYTSCVTITSNTVYELIEAAEYFQIPNLKNCCEIFLKKNLNQENCLKIKTYANRYNIQALTEATGEFIFRNLGCIMKSEDYCKLDVEDVASLLKMETKQKSTDEDKFNGLIKWTKYDINPRRIHFSNLFYLINLLHLSKEFISTVVMKEELILESNACLRLFSATLAHRVFEPTQADQNNVLVIGGNTCPTAVSKYNVNTRQWINMLNTNLARRKASAVRYEQHVYLMGGDDNNGTTQKSIQMLDLGASKYNWETNIPLMKESRSCFSSAVLNDLIYCVGGSNGDYLATCDCYDPALRTWFKICQMKGERCEHALVSARGKVFAIGGWDGNVEASNTVECFDPEVGNWTEISSMKTKRSALCAVVLNDEIYAIGGYNGNNLSSVEKYNLDQRQWMDVASLNEARCEGAACVVNGRIYVFGGLNSKTIEMFDPTLNKWKIEADMDQERRFLSVLSI